MTDVSLEPQFKELINDRQSLGQIISRITAERGSFADITEESLKEEIEQGETVEKQHEDGAKTFLDETNNDRFIEARNELVKLVEKAQNECALNLDMVSLLVSGSRPQQGSISMSPVLKHAVPLGSLTAASVENSPATEDVLTGVGWKSKALTDASKGLRGSAARLATEVDKEDRYWHSVLDIATAGEVLFKIRKGERRGIGLKYGFGDSGSTYRNKGIALVKRSKINGEVEFDFEVTGHRPTNNVVSVSIFNGKTLVGRSSFQVFVHESSDIDKIYNARSRLFEEELFHELLKETHSLPIVEVVDEVIKVKFSDERLEISYMEESDSFADQLDDSSRTESQDLRADFICSALHALLCNLHYQRKQRMEAVLPLVEHESTQGLLRPILSHIAHKKVISRLSKLFELASQSHENLTVQAETECNSAEGYRLGKLERPPLSRHVLLYNKMTFIITTRDPLNPSEPLFELVNDKFKQTVTEIGEVEEWLNWMMRD